MVTQAADKSKERTAPAPLTVPRHLGIGDSCGEACRTHVSRLTFAPSRLAERRGKSFVPINKTQPASARAQQCNATVRLRAATRRAPRLPHTLPTTTAPAPTGGHVYGTRFSSEFPKFQLYSEQSRESAGGRILYLL
jgi:hypothetical protein